MFTFYTQDFYLFVRKTLTFRYNKDKFHYKTYLLSSSGNLHQKQKSINKLCLRGLQGCSQQDVLASHYKDFLLAV